MQCVFSDHDGLKLEISNRKETGKFQNMQRLCNTFMNDTWNKREISRNYNEMYFYTF